MNEESPSLRDEMRQGFADMRHEMTELRQEMAQGFADVREEMGQGFARVDQRLAQLDQDVIDLRQDLGTLTRRVDALEERVRGNGVLLEAIHDDVRQVAEAHLLLAQRVAEYRGESDTQRTILSRLQMSYRDLDRRVTRLEGRAGEAPHP
jgi:chromosome segregation ATPase